MRTALSRRKGSASRELTKKPDSFGNNHLGHQPRKARRGNSRAPPVVSNSMERSSGKKRARKHKETKNSFGRGGGRRDALRLWRSSERRTTNEEEGRPSYSRKTK